MTVSDETIAAISAPERLESGLRFEHVIPASPAARSELPVGTLRFLERDRVEGHSGCHALVLSTVSQCRLRSVGPDAHRSDTPRLHVMLVGSHHRPR